MSQNIFEIKSKEFSSQLLICKLKSNGCVVSIADGATVRQDAYLISSVSENSNVFKDIL